jgi:hypothetical protein
MEVLIMKPGWQTSEFYIALAGQLLAILVLLGIVPAADRATLEGAISRAVEAVAAFAASTLGVWQYIRSRTTVKTEAAIAETTRILRDAVARAEDVSRSMTMMQSDGPPSGRDATLPA